MGKIPNEATRVFVGETFDVYQWRQKMFDGTYSIFEKLKRNHSIDIIAVGKNQEIYILEEEQPGRDPFIGLIGGSGENDEKPLDTAKRELLEETGLLSDDWELFGVYSSSSRIEHESHLFIARNCVVIQEQTLDSGERIHIKQVEWKQFVALVVDPKFRVSEFALELLRYIYLGKEEELKNIVLSHNKNNSSL